MSYDLMVFDPKSAPADRSAFLTWYRDQTGWTECSDYNDPNNCSPQLRAWLLEMVQEYPPMNGPYSDHDYDNPKLADYSIGKSIIYVAFSWSQAEGAYQSMFDLAKRHRVGFFDVSATDGQVWMPAGEHDYLCVHGSG